MKLISLLASVLMLAGCLGNEPSADDLYTMNETISYMSTLSVSDQFDTCQMWGSMPMSDWKESFAKNITDPRFTWDGLTLGMNSFCRMDR